ncbi:MAG: 50S ribosomal protein L25 [Acidobacteriota bacterium]
MSDVTIEVQQRETFGKNANRQLRAAGKIPAVIYGGGGDSTALQVSRRRLEELLRKTADANPIFLLKMAGTDKTRHVMIRELATDPVNGNMIHIDFIRVNMDEKLRVFVAIELDGTPEGVKTDGGMLDFVNREVEIEALPNAIPGHINVDVSELRVGQHLEASALDLPDGVALASEEDMVIVSIQSARVAADEDVEDEDADDEEVAEA